MQRQKATNTQESEQKRRKKNASLARWLLIGGAATGLSALLKLISPPFDPIYFIFEVALSIGCIGYGVRLSAREKNERRGTNSADD